MDKTPYTYQRVAAAAKDPMTTANKAWDLLLDPDRELDELMKAVKTQPHLMSYVREAIDHLQKARTSISMLRMKLEESDV